MNKKDIQQMAERLHLAVTISAPGDGAIRYCIGKRTEQGGFRDMFYACGSREAFLFLRGWEALLLDATRSTGQEHGI